MHYSTLKEERKLWRKGYSSIACIDEVGRGPLAGPVVACAVVINPKHEIRNPKQALNTKYKILNTKLRDSKKLSAKQREYWYNIFSSHAAIQWGIGRVYPTVIDRINIYQATKLAMVKALCHLQAKLSKLSKIKYITNSCYSKKRLYIDFLIVDGNSRLSFKNIPCKAIVKGDEKVFSCAAASVIAKVTRDRMMVHYHKKYPQYGFDRHKGYGTKLHFEMLKKYGPCPIHRRSFTFRI